MGAKTRREFTCELKRDAVLFWENEQTAADGRGLRAGIQPSLLRRWQRLRHGTQVAVPRQSRPRPVWARWHRRPTGWPRSPGSSVSSSERRWSATKKAVASARRCPGEVRVDPRPRRPLAGASDAPGAGREPHRLLWLAVRAGRSPRSCEPGTALGDEHVSRRVTMAATAACACMPLCEPKGMVAVAGASSGSCAVTASAPLPVGASFPARPIAGITWRWHPTCWRSASALILTNAALTGFFRPPAPAGSGLRRERAGRLCGSGCCSRATRRGSRRHRNRRSR